MGVSTSGGCECAHWLTQVWRIPWGLEIALIVNQFTPMKIDHQLNAKKLLPAIYRLFDLSAAKIRSLEKTWDASKGTPVFTVKGKYISRGWTEWTDRKST